MKKLFLTILALSLAFALRGADTYETFVSKAGIKSAGECMRIYKDGSKYWMEFPDSLMGRRVILSSFMRSSSGWTSCGTDISAREVFTLSRTDSLLLLTSPVVLPESSEPSLKKSLARSAIASVRYAFPIQYRNADSTSVVVEVSKLFNPSNKDAFNPAKVQIDGNAMVNKATPKPEFTHFKELIAYPSSTGVLQGVTFKVAPEYDLGGGMLQVVQEEIMSVDGDVATFLTLVPKSSVKVRVADPRIGTINSSRSVFSSDRGTKQEEIVSRWDITGGKKIVVYVDTLFSAVQREAVSRGILVWNKTFEAAGLGSVIEVRPFERGIAVENPLVSKVMADVHSSSGRLSVSVLSDPAAGLVSACSITVPAGIRDYFRMDGLFGISDVDPRWHEYEIPEDAFCEALSAKIMQAFGRVLGIRANVAGSFAYSPSQLRDPGFTQKYGITASVTDDVLFNTLARPGDRERGVVTVMNQPGAYDYMAIEWIYSRPYAASDKALADSLVRSKAGDPAFVFLPAATDSPDPRCCRGDLGNDPFEEYATAIERFKYISANVPLWYERTVPLNTGFRTVLVEQILRHHCTEHKKLARLVGGLYVQDMSSGRKYVPVGKDVQKRALALAINGLDKLQYIDSDKELQAFSGAYNDFSTLMRVNALTQNAMLQRLKWSAVASKLGITEYPVADLLSDITDELTCNLRKGSVPEGEEFLVEIWLVRGLVPSIPAYEKNLREYNHSESMFYAPLPQPAGLNVPVLANACMAELERLEAILKRSLHAAHTEYDRNRIRYLLSQLDGMKKPNTQP
ncbi:MAG: zinc-dependent metalloprotease [Bacteroidales bacterium]|nr:zinc-dependent metalloprotease [Bacteroidales bacterium]